MPVEASLVLPSAHHALAELTEGDPITGEGGLPIEYSRAQIFWMAAIAAGAVVDENRIPLRIKGMAELLVPRTLEQSLGMRDILGEYGFNSEAINFQVSLGTLAHQLEAAKTTEEEKAVRDVVDAMYKKVSPRSKAAFIEGLGFALGEVYLEDETKHLWLTQVDRKIDSLDASPKEKESSGMR